MINKRVLVCLIILVILVVTMLSGPVYANPGVNQSWDWEHEGKTELTWWIDPGLGATWAHNARDVTGTIQTQTGSAWTFREVANRADAQVVIEAVDHNQPGGAQTTFEFVPGSNERVRRRVVEIDPTPHRNEDGRENKVTGWDTAGDNFDPFTVLMHELTHPMRLKHEANTYNTGDLADPITPGRHQYSLSATDIQHLKDSADRTKTPIIKKNATIGPSGGELWVDTGYGIIIPPGALTSAILVAARPILEALPGPKYPSPAWQPMVIGMEITTDVGIVNLLTAATFVLSYSDQLIADPMYFPWGYGINAITMKAFTFDPVSNSWTTVPSSVVDTSTKKVTYSSYTLGGIIGITGQPLYLQVPVGGVTVPVDKLGLLAPHIGLASTILVAAVATAICVKRVKRRKEKQ